MSSSFLAAPFSSRGRSALVMIGVLLTLAPAAHAQDDKRDTLKKLSDQFGDLKALVKEADAVDALTKLNEMESWAREQKGETADQFDRTYAIVLCALGDAARAQDRLSKLPPPAAGDRAALDVQYLVAAVNGDAPLLEQTLKLMKEKAEDKELKSIVLKQRRLKMIGKNAPALKVKTEEVGEIDVFGRNGQPLVIDFWSMRVKPDDTHVAAMRALYAEFKGRNIAFLGVNSDGPARVKEARNFVAEKRYDWPQHYEEKGPDSAPVTGKGFSAGPPPWTVIIDREGLVRGVGDPAEPVFAYTLRSVTAESLLDSEYVKPVPLGGVKAPKKDETKKPETPAPETKPDNSNSNTGDTRKVEPEKKKEVIKPKGELPSNPEAESELHKARAFYKAGKRTDAKRILQEIISKYPGTREAREAQELLGMWR